MKIRGAYFIKELLLNSLYFKIVATKYANETNNLNGKRKEC